MNPVHEILPIKVKQNWKIQQKETKQNKTKTKSNMFWLQTAPEGTKRVRFESVISHDAGEMRLSLRSLSTSHNNWQLRW